MTKINITYLKLQDLYELDPIKYNTNKKIQGKVNLIISENHKKGGI